MTIKGAAESSRLSVRFEPNVRATVHDDAGTLRAGFGCLGTTRDVACGGLPGTQLLGPACLPCSARIELGEGNDTLTLTGTSQKGPFHVDAGGGDDEVHIAGESIALVDGGPGSDVLRADAISELDGGEGPDMLQGAGAFASYAARTAGVTVTLDGVANDGAPGEGDNVTTGSVLGTEGPDRLTGNGAVNDLSGRGGDDVLAGADGNDELSGDAGANTIHAGDGDDRVAGSRVDTVKCGLGDDVATGLRVPGAYGDCETVFESYDVPYLTVSDVAVRRRRPSVTLGWHPYPDVVGGPPVSASGVVEMRYRGRMIARGRFADVASPTERPIALVLSARGKALACRAARTVRLLVVATGHVARPGPGEPQLAQRHPPRGAPAARRRLRQAALTGTPGSGRARELALHLLGVLAAARRARAARAMAILRLRGGHLVGSPAQVVSAAACRPRPYEKLISHGCGPIRFMMFSRLVASSSLWPPDRKTMPGTAAGTCRRRQRSVRSATSSSPGWSGQS